MTRAGEVAPSPQGESLGEGTELAEVLLGGNIANYGLWSGRHGLHGSGTALAGRTGQSLGGAAIRGGAQGDNATRPRSQQKDSGTAPYWNLLEDLDVEEGGPRGVPARGASSYSGSRAGHGGGGGSGPSAVSRTKATPGAAVPVVPRPPPQVDEGLDYAGLFRRMSREAGASEEVRHEVPEGLRHEARQQVPVLQEETRTYSRPEAQPAVRRQGKLILDLDSHIVDVAVDWGKRGFVQAFRLIGRTLSTVQDWSDRVLQSGRELTESHFEGNGVEVDLSDSSCLTIGFVEVDRLVAAIKKDIVVTALRLARSHIGDTGANMLAGALLRNRTLRELTLCHNGIGDEGAEALSAALDQNPALQKLDLSKNAIGAAGAAQLAASLRRNRGLRQLDLSGNPLGDDGAESFAEAIDSNVGGTRYGPRRLLLVDCRVGQRGVARLAKAANVQGGPLVVLGLGERCGPCKDNAVDPEEPGERFIVTCSQAGVEITAADVVQRGQVMWVHIMDAIEVTFNETWFNKSDKASVNVQLAPHRLQIEIAGRVLADLQLYGRIRPEDSTWALSDGSLQVKLAPCDKEPWPSLTRSSSHGGI